ncbi:MAG: thermonuclease family protein [Desulfovibrio sp.]|jgi:endonuclease YncB( thermonuclease family)|nr:thermonuclease family protein [Desulfovibrio sp.]
MNIIAALLFLAIAFPATAFAHPGGLDGYGCHNDRKRGGYHCHRGPLAGQSFASQGEMLAALNAQEQPKQEKRKQVAPQAKAVLSGNVLRVLDGDTLTVRLDGKETRIRVYGVDAPEMKQEYGKEAQEFVENMILTEMVQIETVDTDRYGRTVAIVHLRDGDTLERRLLSAGMAWLYPQYCKRAECAGWKKLEIQARESGQGLWRGKATPPWEWRKENKKSRNPQKDGLWDARG